ncbi:MAG: hypothetical protein KDD38_04005 [Bdellovibrionales bacterium]|nr:hypothetical protein [Bdellovibrionales bacterium]
MKLKVLVLISILFSASVVFAMPEESTFGLEQGSKEWKKKELEDWLSHKISLDLAQFVPTELFKVYADAEFKNSKNTTRKVSNVSLSMLGTVATIVETERAKPQLGLFDRIAKLDVTLVVADSVPEKTVEAMLTVIAKRVPLLDSSRLNTQVVRLERPTPTFSQWLKEFKGVIGGLFALAMLVFAAYQILQKIRIKGSIQFGPVHATAQSAEVSEDESHDEAPFHMAVAQQYSEKKANKKPSHHKTTESISHLGLSLDQVDPASEEQFLNVLLLKSEYANFAQLVRQSLPTELLNHAPLGAVKAALAHLSHWDRLEVIAYAPIELEDKFWQQLPKPIQEARELLSQDIERMRRESKNQAQTPQQAYGRFMKTIREAIRKNKDWSKAVHPHVENWIFVKTKGNEGQPYGTKVA